MWTLGPTSTTSTTVNSVDFWTANDTDVCYSGRMRGVQCGTEVDSEGNGGYNVDDKDASYIDKDTGERYTHVALATKGWGKCSQDTSPAPPSTSIRPEPASRHTASSAAAVAVAMTSSSASSSRVTA